MKDNKHAYARHAETTVEIAAPASELFAFLDDHHNLSSHMSNPSSPMMGGGQMELILDEGKGRVLGSHVVMRGSAFGLRLFVDEIVATRTPPITKSWKTVAERLIVIGAYTLGFTIAGNGTESKLTVWIDYNLPRRGRLWGLIGGKTYANWCVRQIADAPLERFGSTGAAIGGRASSVSSGET
ncbi:SRPBCC family protein [uncultured Schumannella sp.]|uniref:SRPBCC family protein n=1 Tax=uncultured Schumannella sp. TaxID=1195956 RepID=UPI0025F4C86D|nr:SRPBCC family protein [uncultured Schumannella sp.]